jgi:hypothetical protein
MAIKEFGGDPGAALERWTKPEGSSRADQFNAFLGRNSELDITNVDPYDLLLKIQQERPN